MTVAATHLQYDPASKRQIKQGIYQRLYEPVMDELTEVLKGIIVRNTLMGKYSHKSFTYKGKVYEWDTEPAPRKSNRLVPELVPEMESYLSTLNEINSKEMPYVLGYINQVLNASHSLQDYLKLLPDVIHGVVKEAAQSCPCKNTQLSQEAIEALQRKNEQAIQMMKRRMASNLLY